MSLYGKICVIDKIDFNIQRPTALCNFNNFNI
jgi:hypothetical protein